MHYRTMPKNGDELSILGYGCMRLPSDDKGVIDESRAIQQIRDAIDQGINYLDTAWPYHGGQSEPLLGRALQGGYRDKTKIATKLPSWLVKNREDMDRFLNDQLKKLGTDRIDYYLMHALDANSWGKLENLGVVEFLQTAVDDGRIVNPGFSFHGAPEDFNPIVDAYPWVFCQIQYNFLDEKMQAGTAGLQYAASKGMGVIVMEPLRGGNLALPTPPPAVQEIWDEGEQQRTPVGWALRWVWDHPEVIVVLSGMNEESHIAENIKIANEALPNSLTATEQKIIGRAADKYRELMKVSCTGCGYCLPCPSGVMIPECFDVYNKMHMFGNESEAKVLYPVVVSGELTNRPPGYASQCIECGECVDKCPQHIPIPESLALVAEELEGPDLKDNLAIAKSVLKSDRA